MKHDAIVLACVLNLPRRKSRRGRQLMARIRRAASSFTPTDPLLLRRLDGPLFVILAGWDLSPLERSVLSMRLQQ